MGAGGNGSVGSVIVENSCQWDERDGGNPCCCFSNFFFFLRGEAWALSGYLTHMHLP